MRRVCQLSKRRVAYKKKRTDNVERLQKDISEDIVAQIAPTLNATECISLTCVTVVEIDVMQLQAPFCQPQSAKEPTEDGPGTWCVR